MNQEFENIKWISRTETFLWEGKTKFGEIYQNQLMCISQVVKWEKQKRYKYVSSNMDTIDVKGPVSMEVFLRKV